MAKLFHGEWLEKLETAGFAASTSEESRLACSVNKENVGSILKCLELEEVISGNEGLNLLDFYEKGQADFSLFHKDLVRYLYQASQGGNGGRGESPQNDEEINMIVDAYTTPAQRIVKLLVSLKQNLSEFGTLDLA